MTSGDVVEVNCGLIGGRSGDTSRLLLEELAAESITIWPEESSLGLPILGKVLKEGFLEIASKFGLLRFENDIELVVELGDNDVASTGGTLRFVELIGGKVTEFDFGSVLIEIDFGS